MFVVVGNTYQIDHQLLEKVAKSAFSYMDIPSAEIELKFVSTKEILRLNTIYRGVKTPTDVLSFNISDKPLLGQVFICYNLVKRQAERMGKPFAEEVSLLLVHGILHIAGYDHADKETASEMQRIEANTLTKLGMTR